MAPMASFPGVPQLSSSGSELPRGLPVPVQIYPYELLLVKTRGRNQLPKDVDRTRLEVRRAFSMAGNLLRGTRSCEVSPQPQQAVWDCEGLSRSTRVPAHCHGGPAAALAWQSCSPCPQHEFVWQEQEGAGCSPSPK